GEAAGPLAQARSLELLAAFKEELERLVEKHVGYAVGNLEEELRSTLVKTVKEEVARLREPPKPLESQPASEAGSESADKSTKGPAGKGSGRAAPAPGLLARETPGHCGEGPQPGAGTQPLAHGGGEAPVPPAQPAEVSQPHPRSCGQSRAGSLGPPEAQGKERKPAEGAQEAGTQMKGPGDFSARQWRKWREQQEREELAQLPPAKKKKVAQDLRKKLKGKWPGLEQEEDRHVVKAVHYDFCECEHFEAGWDLETVFELFEDCPKAALCEATERNDAIADKPQRDLERVQEEPTAPLAATASAKGPEAGHEPQATREGACDQGGSKKPKKGGRREWRKLDVHGAALKEAPAAASGSAANSNGSEACSRPARGATNKGRYGNGAGKGGRDHEGPPSSGFAAEFVEAVRKGYGQPKVDELVEGPLRTEFEACMATVEGILVKAGPQKAAECQAALLHTIEQLMQEK
ncbi:unnamed protein product, partial [Prorocentrum cordatum]